jgi:hypothetical protein
MFCFYLFPSIFLIVGSCVMLLSFPDLWFALTSSRLFMLIRLDLTCAMLTSNHRLRRRR